MKGPFHNQIENFNTCTLTCYIYLNSEDEEEEMDFSKGINEFLRLVKQRKERREELSLNPTLEEVESTVGIESRIVACATWEKSHM